MPVTAEPRSETFFFPSRQSSERLEGKSVVVLDVEEATGRPRLVAAQHVTPEMRIGLFVGNNPINAVDPWGLLTVHYWPASPGHYGHISITLNNGTYISNWPDGGHPPFGSQDTRNPNYDRDAREEGFEPHDLPIDGLDEDAIEDWWKDRPRKDGFSGATYNCTHTAGDALKKGGLDKFPNRPLLPAPESFWNDLNKILSPSGPPFKMLLGGPLPTL